MRKVTYGAACSLDGFIAAADGAIDWLHYSGDVSAIAGGYWSRVDAVLMGRRTWEVAVAMQRGGSKRRRRPPPGSPRTYVFSRTLASIDEPGAALVRGDAGDFVRDLKRQPGGEICVMGGGVLGASLIDAGVVDEVGLNVHPVLLGGGVPLFGAIAHRVALELIESRAIDGGCVYSTYRVAGPR